MPAVVYKRPSVVTLMECRRVVAQARGHHFLEQPCPRRAVVQSGCRMGVAIQACHAHHAWRQARALAAV